MIWADHRENAPGNPRDSPARPGPGGGAAPGDNEAMPLPSRRLKELIEGTVDHHASQRWPALEEVTIRWRGSYGYLTGYLSENDDDTIPLCRIGYLGVPDNWAFAIWQASTDGYAESVLLDGQPTGHPNQALDTACTLYLADAAEHPKQHRTPQGLMRGCTRSSAWPAAL